MESLTGSCRSKETHRPTSVISGRRSRRRTWAHWRLPVHTITDHCKVINTCPRAFGFPTGCFTFSQSGHRSSAGRRMTMRHGFKPNSTPLGSVGLDYWIWANDEEQQRTKWQNLQPFHSQSRRCLPSGLMTHIPTSSGDIWRTSLSSAASGIWSTWSSRAN